MQEHVADAVSIEMKMTTRREGEREKRMRRVNHAGREGMVLGCKDAELREPDALGAQDLLKRPADVLCVRGRYNVTERVFEQVV